MEKLLEYGKINILRLVQRGQYMGLIHSPEETEYPEFIHALWSSFLNNHELGEEAQRLDYILGRGDSIQLLSDALADSSLLEFKIY